MEAKLTTNDAARMLDIAPATVLYYAKLDRLKYERTKSGIRLFDRREIERFAQVRKKAKRLADAC